MAPVQVTVTDGHILAVALLAGVALACVAVLRLVVVAATALLDRLLWPPSLRAVVLTTTLFAAWLMAQCRGDVTLALLGLAASLSLVLAANRRTFLLTMVICFATLSLAGVPLLSHSVGVRSRQETHEPWVVPFRGAMVFFSTSSDVVHLDSDGSRVLAFAVQRMPSAVAPELAVHAKQFPDDTPSSSLATSGHDDIFVFFPGVTFWSDTGVDQNGGRTSSTRREGEARSERSAVGGLRRSLYSVGVGTVVYTLDKAGDRIPAIHEVTLLGSESWLIDAVIRCQIGSEPAVGVADWVQATPDVVRGIQGPAPLRDPNVSASLTPAFTPGHRRPCMQLGLSTKVSRIRIEVYQAGKPGPFESLNVPSARSCPALLSYMTIAALRTRPELLLRCVNASTSREMVQLLGGSEEVLPPAFVAAVPRGVAWKWRMPNHLENAMDAAAYVGRHVALPLLARAWEFGAVLATVASQRVHGILRALAPLLARGWRTAGSAAAGTFCEVVGDRHVRFCELAAARFGEETAAFLAARQWTRLAVDSSMAFLDMIDVVPGVWSVYKWAWRAEWYATGACLGALRWVLGKTVESTAVPLWWVCRSVSVHRVRRPLLQALLLMRWYLYHFLVAAAAVLRALTSMVLRIYAKEWELVCFALVKLGSLALVTLHGLFFILGKAGRLLLLAASLYFRTSFSAEVFVACLQSIVLLVVLRSEIRSASRQQSKWQSSLLSRMGVDYVAAVAAFMKTHTYPAAVYVIAHFAVGVLLVGLSVLPMMSKMYQLVLYLVLPTVSSYAYLLFFFDEPPTKSVMSLTLVKAIFKIAVDYTIGDLVSYIVHEFMVFLSLMIVAGVAAFVFRYRNRLGQQIQLSVDAVVASVIPTEAPDSVVQAAGGVFTTDEPVTDFTEGESPAGEPSGTAQAQDATDFHAVEGPCSDEVGELPS